MSSPEKYKSEYSVHGVYSVRALIPSLCQATEKQSPDTREKSLFFAWIL